MGSRGANCSRSDCPSPRGHWSHMSCKVIDDHQAHDWDSEFTIYGPYRCDGVGIQAPPPDPPRTEYVVGDPSSLQPTYGSEALARDLNHLGTNDGVIWERTVTYSQWRRVKPS